jgi:hypothetical protein
MRGRTGERGAAAILVAGSLFLLMGVAAVAVDLGAVYAEDRADQTAADLGVLAGVLEFTGANASTGARDSVLDFVAANLTTSYSASEWRDIWTACTDPDRPTAFNPVPAPSGWGGNLECISGSNDSLRVRVPDQIVETFFGRTVGVTSIPASAVAQAQARYANGAGGVRPFGVLNGLPAGQVCLATATGGQARPPCDGSVSGNFGTLNSPTFGSDTTVSDCGTPQQPELLNNIAVGVDHLIGIAPALPGSGGPHGGFPAATTRLDQCTVSGGTGVPSDPTPPVGPVNTMNASTGASEVKQSMAGLITGTPADFANSTTTVTPLLQQSGPGVLSQRTLSQRVGPTQYDYVVDNTPLWMHIPATLPAGLPASCDRSTIAGSASPSDAMETCLAAYEAGGSGQAPLFGESIAGNPRFGWVPQFHFTTWGSGNHWQPIARYRMVYFDAMWFNCNGNFNNVDNTDPCDGSKGLIFRPSGPTDDSDLKVGNGANMKQLRLDQVSAFLIPIGAVPASVAGEFPGGSEGPFEVRLTR